MNKDFSQAQDHPSASATATQGDKTAEGISFEERATRAEQPVGAGTLWQDARGLIEFVSHKVKNLWRVEQAGAKQGGVSGSLAEIIKNRLAAHVRSSDDVKQEVDEGREVNSALIDSILQCYREGEVPGILFVGENFEGACNSRSCPSFAFGRELADRSMETLMLDGGNPFEEDIEGSTALDYGFNELLAGETGFEDVVRSDFKSDLQYVLAGSEAVREAALNSPAVRTGQIFSAMQLVYNVIILRVDEEMARLLLRQVPHIFSHIVFETENNRLIQDIKGVSPAFVESFELYSSGSPAFEMSKAS